MSKTTTISQHFFRVHFFRFSIRSLSTRPEVYQFHLGRKSAEIIKANSDAVKKYFKNHKNSHIKPFNLRVFHQHSIEFAKKITDADPILKEELEHIRTLKPEIIFIPQIPISASVNTFPNGHLGLSDNEFLKETITSMLTIGCFAHLFGIEPTEPSFIFSQKATSYEVSSTNTGLDWHNDGWQRHPSFLGMDTNLMLLGIVGNQKVLTEVISLRKILEILYEDGQEDLIEQLSQDHFIAIEDCLDVIAPIIHNQETIRFASRAAHDFRQTKSLSNKATLMLKEYLQKITPSFSTCLEEGDLLVVKNYETLHKRTIVPNTKVVSGSEDKFSGQRLLTRVIGASQ